MPTTCPPCPEPARHQGCTIHPPHYNSRSPNRLWAPLPCRSSLTALRERSSLAAEEFTLCRPAKRYSWML
eukprot:scaffold21395_cov113-Isochrysis_galbana.AAC.3